MNRDGRWVLTARATRSLAYGLFVVLLGLHLQAVGLTPFQIGLVITVALIGSAGQTALLALAADRLGRRRALLWSGGLMVMGGLAFAFAHTLVPLLFASLFGNLNPSAAETGPFETVESSVLAQVVPAAGRNRVFGVYHSVGALGLAFGSLAAGALEPLAGWAGVGTYRLGYLLYTAAAIVSLISEAQLSPSIEAPHGTKRTGWALVKSRRTVARLAALFSLDAFAGGFVAQSLVVYWFNLRFGVGLSVLGPVFAAVSLVKAISYLVAVRLANRIGLIRTMVFTHLPSNILLMLLPAMPTLGTAIALLLVRHTLAQMDVPARSSYVVAVVSPEERTAAAGATMLVRPVATAFSPVLAGWAIGAAAAGTPFVLAGALKIIYDLALYAGFRRLRPEEERSR